MKKKKKLKKKIKKKFIKKVRLRKKFNNFSKIKKKNKSKKGKIKKNKKKIFIKNLIHFKKKTKTKDLIILKIIKIQNRLTNFPKIKFSFFSSLEKKIESFFNGIESKIISYKTLREEEKQKNIIQKLERE